VLASTTVDDVPRVGRPVFRAGGTRTGAELVPLAAEFVIQLEESLDPGVPALLDDRGSFLGG
jgi:hypothetical protein